MPVCLTSSFTWLNNFNNNDDVFNNKTLEFFHSIFFVRGQTVIYRWGSLAGVRCAIRRALSSHSAERNWETSEGSSYVFCLLILEPFFLPLMVKVDAKFMVFIWVLLKLCTHLKINFNNVTYCVGRPPWNPIAFPS